MTLENKNLHQATNVAEIVDHLLLLCIKVAAIVVHLLRDLGIDLVITQKLPFVLPFTATQIVANALDDFNVLRCTHSAEKQALLFANVAEQ